MMTRTALGAAVGGLALVLTTALMSGAVPRVAGLGPSAADSARWGQHLAAMQAAVDRSDIPEARKAWQAAYAAALGSRRWEALVDTADAHLRLAEVAGTSGAPRARELYLSALFRARDAGSRPGVLRVASAFETLGDRGVATEARRMAARLPADN
jgi:hypothetical protein